MPTLKTITLNNTQGLRLEVSNYGATITALYVPNKQKTITNVIVGLPSAEAYTTPPYTTYGLYLGATIGRYAGRISAPKKEALLAGSKLSFINGAHLHGGNNGFDKKYWTIENQEDTSVILSYLSKHMEEGYPGNLKTTVTYILTEGNEVIVTYTATTDITTYVNLTNHAYFNLNGHGNILDHMLHISSDNYIETSSDLIPTGQINNVVNTPFDRTIVSKIGRPDFTGYDNTFVLNNESVKASLYAPTTGIHMDVYTNQPSLVVFTPKRFPELSFRDQVTYSDFSAICFETQKFPDAPNQRHFPSALLHPEETYTNESRFSFTLIA